MPRMPSAHIICVSTGGSKGYADARAILKNRFGNDHLVCATLLKGLRDGGQAKPPIDMLKLSDDLQNVHMTLKSANQPHEVDTQGTVSDVIIRLPTYCREEWTKRAMMYRREHSKYPGYEELRTSVEEASADANDPAYGKSVFVPDGIVRHCSKDNCSSFNTSTRPLCLVCDSDHRIIYCDQFKGMTVKMRKEFASDHGLCFNCLYGGHYIKDCRSKLKCNIEGCIDQHNTLLHNSDGIVNTAVCSSLVSHMPVVRVLVNGSYTAHALLDTASTNSFCSMYIANKLGLKGKSTDYQLSTLYGNSANVTDMVSVKLSTISGDNVRSLSCHVVNHIPASTTPVDVSKYDYLQNLRFSCNVRVDFLIGQDNAGMLVPLEVRHGVDNELFATRTLYGWCLNGPAMTSEQSRAGICNFVSNEVDDRLDRLWEIDYDGNNIVKQCTSRDDVNDLQLEDVTSSIKDCNLDRPTDLRLVFDCANEFNG